MTSDVVEGVIRRKILARPPPPKGLVKITNPPTKNNYCPFKLFGKLITPKEP